ncbi:patched domain-containing protein 3 [Agrilus planipennis]|uniref:Patched domain-containing protein 3 n=1 Tax=Agrilus planipennis TaxID=224129 RepID=A0A7F5RIN1_AGRPL|nr:patched domain-containing protein 3 [Agrilus planipennis]
MKMGLRIVDDLLNKSFYRLGRIVGHYPGYFIIVPVLLTLLAVTGYQKLNNNIDPEYLFSPINGAGKIERATVENFFKMNYTNRFSVARITRAGRFGRVIVTANDGDRNMLRVNVWKELRLLDDIIRNITVYADDEYFRYEDICARWMDECFKNDILNLDVIMNQVESGELNLTFPLMLNPFTWEIHAFPVFFGGTEVSEDNFIVSVPSVQLVYFGNADSTKRDRQGKAWEDAFLDTVGKAQDDGVFKHIRIARFASRTLDVEMERNTRTVIPYFTSTFLVMAVFSIVTCMMTDWVRSKPWLGLLGNISALMATASGFGTCMYLGVDFIGLNLAAPFLMIAIGIDDTFVMLAAWRRTSIKDPVPERMAKMLSEAAVSITITSVTDVLSFIIGTLNPFPSIQIFCIYSCAAAIFTFVWHLTFFAACMAISGYCEQKNLHSVVCVKVEPVSKSRKVERNWFYRAFCTGGVAFDDIDNPEDNKENGIMAFFRDYFAVFLNNSCVKIIVIVVFGLYLLGAGYGVTKIEEGLERRKVAKSDSYAIEFFDREDDYFREFPYRIQVVVSGEYDYWDPKIQEGIENLTQTFENTSYISGGLYTESWLRSFIQYARENEEFLNTTIKTKEGFMKTLKEFWLVPSSSFSLDVKFNEVGDKIIAMRFLIQAVNISGTEHERQMVGDLRKISRESNFNVSVFHPYFVYFDQFELVKPMSIQNMLVGGLVMMLVSFIFIPNVLCSIWVALSIISIETGVVGYMALWSVNLDSISMINLIMCIGFSVDFTAHICYAYMSSECKRPADKMKEALYALGLPIFQGAFSTILGMAMLLFPGSYIFDVFFKMVFLVVFFGAMHGLFLLPVLLSLFGPGSCTNHDKEEKEMQLSSVEKSFPHPYCIPHPQFTLNGTHLGSTFKQHQIMNMEKPPNKHFLDIERDLGLGTSEENSSESGSNQSNKQVVDNDTLQKRDKSNWKENFHLATRNNDFQTPRTPIDLFGAPSEKDCQNISYTRRRSIENWEAAEESSPDYSASNNRKYIPQERQRSNQRRRPLGRSYSHHHLQYPKYIQELRFP